MAQQNPFEEAWVRQLMHASQQPSQQPHAQQAQQSQQPYDSIVPAPSEDADLQQAMRESLEDDDTSEGVAARFSANLGLSEEAAMRRALEESTRSEGAVRLAVRHLLSPEGPFCPAGLVNSGNSCFWNALLQAIFLAAPVFRGALFQCEFHEDAASSAAPQQKVLKLLRDLFAEMEMGLGAAIDAGELYRSLFERADEADISEQMQRVFELLSSGPGSLAAVCNELFSGDLIEHLEDGTTRKVSLESCQLDLCVTQPGALESLLVEHTRDVCGSVRRRSYRLPPVLWINLDRFAFDRGAQRGHKRQVHLSFPERLNTWMLIPPDAPWAQKICACAVRRQELQAALHANQKKLLACTTSAGSADLGLEEKFAQLVEQQEGLLSSMALVDKEMEQFGKEQELLYKLEAIVVHKGRLDTGHYYTFGRSPQIPSSDARHNAPWCCFNDATVTLCSAEEMLRQCEGGDAPEKYLEGKSTSWSNGVPCAGVPEPVEIVSPRSDSTGPESPSTGSPTAKRRSQSRWCTPWPSMSSVRRSLGRSSNSSSPAKHRPQTAEAPKTEVFADANNVLPSAVAPPQSPEKGLPNQSTVSSPCPASPSSAMCDVEATAARCLVYVRSGAGGESLLGEIRRRVPGVLQESIDKKNLALLKSCAEAVADDFVKCIRNVICAAAPGEDADTLPEYLRNALEAAIRVRTEGGMARTRVYLLRACWRGRVPWLPEELNPSSSPPDFRMHYGGDARRLLLDALIKRGQHDMASLITQECSRESDSFVPSEMATWFSQREL